METQNIIVIKTGFFETFAEDSGSIVSLGDILRTTVLRHNLLEKGNVHWITSIRGLPLIQPQARLYLSTIESQPHFENIFQEASLIINLERHNETSNALKKFSDKVVGFIPTKESWILKGHTGETRSLQAWNEFFEERGLLTWNSRLLNLLGINADQLIPTFARPFSAPENDVGLNWQPGKKWPSKNMGQENWQQLEKELSPFYKVSWQRGFDSISEYADWIASNRLLVTIDSLGLHLAVAMQVPVVALFGPTNPLYVDKYNRDAFLSLTQMQSLNCGPCYLESCNQQKHCSNYFPFKTIKTEIDRLIGPSK